MTRRTAGLLSAAMMMACGLCAAAAPFTAPGPWPGRLLLQSGGASSPAGSVSLPLPRDTDPRFARALAKGALCLDGRPVQGQTVAVWPGAGARPRRMILRWAGAAGAAGARRGFTANPGAARNAGWDFAYRLVEGNTGQVPWVEATRGVPLEKTEYEMHQLDLKHRGRSFGVRLGLRTGQRIYWWQFVRADFLQRGPVFDIVRAGGPIYNGQSTMQSDITLVMYASGVVEATAHFVSHRREDAGMDLEGVPVVAFDVPGAPPVDQVLDGTRQRLELGACRLDLDTTVHMADAARPGRLRTEGGVIVLQPWLDQQIAGGKLVDRTGVPEHRIIHNGGTTAEVSQRRDRGAADRYYVTTVGDRLWPIGVARSFRFVVGLPGVEPSIARYQAPPWWHAMAGALPTGANLPAKWWAVPHALETVKNATAPDAETGPFEYGRAGADGEGGLGASLMTLGQAAGRPDLCRDALPACYWRADIPIHHTDFSVSEDPFYGWQWMVQPYLRFQSVMPGYWETGDPYLLETAELAADGYYRFFVTNRPHRFVGRDALPVEDLLDLFVTTGDRHYLSCAQRVLRTARQSYQQTAVYWPGHQSGSGPNGVARRQNYLYIPAVLARLHVKMVEDAGEVLTAAERDEAMRFAAFAVNLVETRWRGEDRDWWQYACAWLYSDITGLADWRGASSARYEALLDRYNRRFDMPMAHGGGRMHSWIVGAIRFDAWVWGARWVGGVLRVKPRMRLLADPRAPRSATIDTPGGPVKLVVTGGRVRVQGKVAFPVVFE